MVKRLVLGTIAGGPLEGAVALLARRLPAGGFAVTLLAPRGAYAAGDLVHVGSGEFEARAGLAPRQVSLLRRLANGGGVRRDEAFEAAVLAEAGLVAAERVDGLPVRWAPLPLGRALLAACPVRRSTVRCALCGQRTAAAAAHRHDGGFIGDECCWDERLRATE
jgi:hypothetical protein